MSALRRGGAGSILLVLATGLLFLEGPRGPGAGAASDDVRLPAQMRVHVVRAVDGDTVEVRLADGSTEDVRYVGIDTPESVDPDKPVQCFGPRASHYNEHLVEGRDVTLVFDHEQRDIYGRLLAYIHLGHRFINAQIIRNGYARVLTIPPNDTHSALFERLALQAGRKGLGLWGKCPV